MTKQEILDNFKFNSEEYHKEFIQELHGSLDKKKYLAQGVTVVQDMQNQIINNFNFFEAFTVKLIDKIIECYEKK
jgi:hypothetical protein